MLRRLFLVLLALGTPVASSQPGPKPTPSAERIELNHRYAAMNRRLAENPADVGALIERGRVRLKLEDLAGALEDLDKAISLEPANAEGLVARGAALIEDGRTVDATKDLKRAIELDPRNAEAHKTLGTALAQRFEPARAIEEYTRALELDPSLTSALFNRAVVRRQSGDLAGALADADQLVTLEPKRSDSFSLRAGIQLQRKDASKAIADYDRAIALDPNDPRAYGGRASAKSAAGDAAGSAADAARAQNVVPSAKAVPRRPATPTAGEPRVLDPGTGLRRRLRLVLKSGSRYRFQTDQRPVSSEGPAPPGASTVMSSRALFSVGAVSGGRAAVSSVLEDVQRSGSGDAATFMTSFRPKILGLKTTASYDELGRRTGWKLVTKLEGELANIVAVITRSQGERDLGFLGVLYPSTDVGVGARWQTALDLRPSLADAEPAGTEVRGGVITVTYELVAFGKRAGKDAAQLGVTTAGQGMLLPKGVEPAQGDKFRVTASGSMWVELANGIPLESESDTKYESDRRDIAYRTVTKTTLTRVEGGPKAPRAAAAPKEKAAPKD